MKFDKDFKKAIEAMPESEKDKLLLRLLKHHHPKQPPPPVTSSSQGTSEYREVYLGNPVIQNLSVLSLSKSFRI